MIPTPKTPVERHDKESRKVDKAFEAMLAAEAKQAQALWEEVSTCRNKLSKFDRSNANPNVPKVASTAIESLNKQADIMASFGKERNHVMSGESGNLDTRGLSALTDYSLAGAPVCTEQWFRPPYARGYIYAVPWPGVPVPGVDVEATEDRKTGSFFVSGRLFENGGTIYADAVFVVRFRLSVPVNPILEAVSQDSGSYRPTRFGRMQVTANFAPLQTEWMVAANNFSASSSGYVSITVFGHSGSGGSTSPLSYPSRLWKYAAGSGQYNPESDYRYEFPHVVKSPWFGADSLTEYSAYVSIRVALETDGHPESGYGFAYGSIGGQLGSIVIKQCLF